jgi:hypothetical protein
LKAEIESRDIQTYMNETLIDIEVLTLRCRSEQSKTYISDAVLCYRSGAYRATIVSVWIAVIFDLVDKIRELSVAGESRAVVIWNKYEKYIQQIEDGNDQGIKGALEFERELIGICRKELQFFDQQQMVDLERLREDRHRCAHPSFQRIGEPYRPSAEQARLHLTNAVSHVLSQPPVQGKAQLARLQSLVGSAYFPLDVGQAVTQLRASALGRANEALVNAFIDMAVFGYFKQDSPMYWKEQAGAALEAVLEMYRPQAETRLIKQFNRVLHDASDAELGRAILLVASVSTSWRFLEQPSKEKIILYIQNSDPMLILPTLSKLKHVPELTETIKAKFADMNSEQLHAASVSFGLGEFSKSRALELLSQVGSWNSANDVINRAIFPIFELLSKDDFITLIRFPETNNADLPGATAYSRLIEKLRATDLFTGPELDALLRANRAQWLVRDNEE